MRPAVPTVVAVALVGSVAVALLVGGATSTAAFGSFNPDWDGTSELRDVAESAGAEPVVVRNASDYETHGDGDVAFVLAPEREYDDEEAARVRRFVERGGTLVVADRDGPHAPDLLASVGAEARPVGPVLRDEREYYRDPALPVAESTGNHSLVADDPSLTLNHGTAVEPNGATVLLESSGYSYLDRDESESRSGGEVVRSYPVATVESVGDGRVVVVGDPSVFINVMQGRSGNEAFTRALVDDADSVLVDVSKSSLPPLVGALLTIRGSPLLQVGLGLGGLATLALGGRILDRRRKRDVDRPEALEASTVREGLLRRDPALDSSRVAEVTKGVIGNRTEHGDDE